MKAFITVELELSFTYDQTKQIDESLEKEGKTFKYHVSETLERLFIEESDIPKEAIKSIEVNRVD